MKIILIVFFICFGLGLIFFLPIKIRTAACFNLGEIEGNYNVKALGINIVHGKIYKDETGQIEFENEDIFKKKPEKNFIKILVETISKKIYIEKFIFNIKCGVKNEVMATAIISGVINYLISIVYFLIKNKFNLCEFNFKNETDYLSSKFEFSLNFVFSVSLIWILISLILSMVKARREK
ncbi:MAG: hypothetical protein IJ538_01585 [Clostridia bacterium]|nr:hypothetical protein [Clostridia bacterium]